MNGINAESSALANMTLWEATALYGDAVVSTWNDAVYTKGLNLESRRYIGCKTKLLDWIFSLIEQNTNNAHVFCDIFAGTGSVANKAIDLYDRVIINDFLYSNNVIYKAFFGNDAWNKTKVINYLDSFNRIDPSHIRENYFSKNFGGKFFEHNTAKLVGYIRESINECKPDLTNREYYILLASLIYSIDRKANTLGHFDAYIKKNIAPQKFIMQMINVHRPSDVDIYQEDANQICRTIQSDITYIDPPYNSRQYSRFYHVYENLVQWKKPELFGTARKPKEENMSNYCRVKAFDAFTDLVSHLRTRYIVVSYNNTYHSKSSSSANKIKLEQIEDVLDKCGTTKVFTHSFSPFNAGKTEFDDHKEYLFITEVDHEKRNRSFPTILRG